jgi:hypothetical protein
MKQHFFPYRVFSIIAALVIDYCLLRTVGMSAVAKYCTVLHFKSFLIVRNLILREYEDVAT